MPFDSTDFTPGPSQPERPKITDNEACAIIVILSVVLLLAPFSMAALVDLVAYLKGG